MQKTEIYNPLITNAVYSKKINVQSERGNIEANAIMLVRRYSEPTEDQVVEYLQRRAGEVQAAASLLLPEGIIRRTNKSLLDQAIITLPDRIIRDITTGDEDCIRHIRDHTPFLNPEQGESPAQCLQVGYGLLLQEIIEGNRPDSDDPRWYDLAFSDQDLRNVGLGKKLGLTLKLKDWNLPPQDIVNLLISHRVHGSEMLEISRKHYPQILATEITDFIYSSFPKRKHVLGIRDDSTKALEEASLASMLDFHKRLEIAATAQQPRENEQNEEGRKRPNSGRRLGFG